ncbi:UDPGT domain-containing protein [Cephalotus follicularis]|uniref:Glycosyltransferase n=1 Tax=Cephalotus follicularis TaxID=3775 RepID=A0A1Q3AT83_CEPFO|nr:UDPGT domain-containing protein [Cephalotus follicularis]
MASTNHHLHFLLVPLMSQSHLIPFTDMAKLLAHRGQTVTIIMTPLNAARFNAIIDYAINSNLKIQFITLNFPCQEAGLPEGCENLDSLPSPDLSVKFLKASNTLQKPVENLLRDLQITPTCIISDFCLTWTTDLALKLRIPRIVFHTVSCFTLLCSHNLETHKVYESITSDSQPFLVPEIPDRIEFTKAQLPAWARRSSNEQQDLFDKYKEAEQSAQGLLVNTCEEIEPSYVEGYQKVAMNNVWCIGPLSLCNKTASSKFERGNKPAIDEHRCLKWLDSMKPRSAIYVCFGSLSHLLPNQLIELGLGLEASNRPLIWTIRKESCSKEFEKWLIEQKLEERLNGRGLIIRGWAPQMLILSHPAIGGFLTHCGWNSTLEGISSGVPMITWPLSAEQFYNAKLIVQVLKTGVYITDEALVQCQKVGALVKKEDIRKGIEKSFDEGEDGVERRKRAQELGERARRALEEGGSYLNVTLFISNILCN